MRKKIIAGNWKMNTTLNEAIELAKDIVERVKGIEDVDIVICPPYTNLYPVYQIIKDTNVKLGAQDLHWEDKGAYTGKISADMLLSVGVEYVIIGHSEQRTYFGETDETVNKKVKKALQKGLKPIVCVGETLEEREAGKTKEVVKTQVLGAFKDLSKEEVLKNIIAYEPVWAIGTGRNATPEQADEVHAFIREVLADLYDDEVAQKIRIQYGGSMKPENAKALLEKENIDGGLIGGASLKGESFYKIIKPE